MRNSQIIGQRRAEAELRSGRGQPGQWEELGLSPRSPEELPELLTEESQLFLQEILNSYVCCIPGPGLGTRATAVNKTDP